MEEIHTGSDPIVAYTGTGEIIIHKEYGPTIFMPIRVTPNIRTGMWDIERQLPALGLIQWDLWARIPAQLDSDFEE